MSSSEWQGIEFVRSEIRRMRDKGFGEKVKVYQDKRYIPADAISVDGRWYPVVLDLDAPYAVMVSTGQPVRRHWDEDNQKWLNENGRFV